MTREGRLSDGCGSDGAAYVLGALEPREAEIFQRHLTVCATCREEVAVLQRVTDELPMAVPQYRLPAPLRRRVVRTVRAEARRRKRGRRRRRPALAQFCHGCRRLVTRSQVPLRWRSRRS